MERRELCPASYRLEKDLPSISTDNSVAGTAKHKAIAEAIENFINGKAVEITDTDVQTAFDRFVRIYESIDGDKFVLVEKTISCSYCGEVLTSGTPDVVIVASDSVVVIDWKFGHRAVTEAANNPQGATYAISAMRTYNRKIAEVYFVNPVINQASDYIFTDGGKLLAYVVKVVNACQKEDAPIICGEKQCRYCKANLHGTCPAINGKFNSLVSASGNTLPMVGSLTDDQLLQLKENWDMVAKLGERIDEEIKARVEFNNEWQGFYFKAVSGGREITDINAAFDAVSSDITAGELLSVCNLSVSEFESLYAAKMKDNGRVNTIKEGKAMFANVMAEHITRKPDKFTLCRK